MIEQRSDASTKDTRRDTQAEIVGKVRELVVPYYNGLDPWHNLTHGERVVAAALEINKIERADALLVEAGAWLHQYHAPNLELLEPVLAQLPIPDSTRNDLRQIVTLCRPNMINTRPEGMGNAAYKAAQIVFDADALDLIGAPGIIRELSCNLITRNKPQAQALAEAHHVHDLFAASLQTKTAKSIAQPGIELSAAFWQQFAVHEKMLRENGAGNY